MSDAALDQTEARPPRRVSWDGKRLEAGCVVAASALAALVLARPDAAFPVVAAAVAALVAWIVAQDLRTFTIADGAVVSIAVLAVAYRWSAGDTALAMGLDCLLTGGVLLAFREIYFHRKGVDGLGLGDVKLAAAGGLLVGAGAFASALLGASLLGLGVVAIGRLARGRGRSDRLAFGAVLAPAIFVAFVVQQVSILPAFVGP